MKLRIGHIFLMVFLFSVLDVSAYTDEDCIECHDMNGTESALKISLEQFNLSIHRSVEGEEVSCQDCHVNVFDEEHQETMGSGAVNCIQCHEQENRHGIRAVSGRPKCYNCHTQHNIRSKEDPQSSVHRQRLQQTCAGCHPAQGGVEGYFAWFTSIQVGSHAKQDFSLEYTKSNCLGCHQGGAVHGENDPVDDQNCYSCHLDDEGKTRLLGVIHPDATLDKQPGVFAAAVTYQVALLIMVLAGFRWIVRFFSERKKPGHVYRV